MARDFTYEIMPEIKERWSTRAFSPEPVKESELMAVLEAARYAPSCFNEQPWRFILATEEKDLEVLRGLLTGRNKLWAPQAPVLILIISRKNFALNNLPNRCNQFDAGTAWGYLSLEAQRRGLITHGMVGFDAKAAREKLSIPADYDIIAMVAVGKKGSAEDLSVELRQMEQPGTRKKLKEIVLHVNSFR